MTLFTWYSRQHCRKRHKILPKIIYLLTGTLHSSSKYLWESHILHRKNWHFLHVYIYILFGFFLQVRHPRCVDRITSIGKMQSNMTVNIHIAIAQLLARSQYSEGPATDHLDTGFSWFPCVYKQMLRWLPRFQVATTRFSCIPPDLKLNVSVTSFILLLHVK
jgi:hypothetical protein